MNAPKPMDPDRLADLRQAIACGRRPQVWSAELLADRDYQELRAAGAERDRDSAATGLAEQRTEVARLEAMLIARQDAELEAGPPSEMDLRLLHATREIARLRARVRVEAQDVERACVTWSHLEAWLPAEMRNGLGDALARVSVGFEHIAEAIESLARQHKRPGLDILDEMATPMSMEQGRLASGQTTEDVERGAIPTEPGWYWVELNSGVFVVEVRRWGREPHRLTFMDPTESKQLLIPMVSQRIRSWGPRVPDWSPRT